MLNYKTLTGGEVLYDNGMIYFWMPWGCYSVRASTIKRHRAYTGPRQVTFTFVDTTNHTKYNYTETYPEGFDDYEIIYRWISGSGACDCHRGKIVYGDNIVFPCNKGPNRFVLRKMAIKGEHLNCIIDYKEYR